MLRNEERKCLCLFSVSFKLHFLCNPDLSPPQHHGARLFAIVVLSKSGKVKNSAVRAAQPSGAATPEEADTRRGRVSAFFGCSFVRDGNIQIFHTTTQG